MHGDSRNLLEQALTRYQDAEAAVLDVGSLDINGSFRSQIEDRGWAYIGLDIQPGRNVDVVADDPYSYPFKDGDFDIVISGSAAYTILDLVSWTHELARLVRPGGMVIVITPSLAKPPTEGSPADLWRMTDDAIRLLFHNTGLLSDIEVTTLRMDVMGTGVRIATEEWTPPVVSESLRIEEDAEPDVLVQSKPHPSQRSKTALKRGSRR